jgi:hypothetical protein
LIDGEELFHLMYNPFYNDWKLKKDQIKNNLKNKSKKSKIGSLS